MHLAMNAKKKPPQPQQTMNDVVVACVCNVYSVVSAK